MMHSTVLAGTFFAMGFWFSHVLGSQCSGFWLLALIMVELEVL